ncbi:hypothetical protein FB451DRAFT_1302870, partial [Mycena latifolia]
TYLKRARQRAQAPNEASDNKGQPRGSTRGQQQYIYALFLAYHGVCASTYLLDSKPEDHRMRCQFSRIRLMNSWGAGWVRKQGLRRCSCQLWMPMYTKAHLRSVPARSPRFVVLMRRHRCAQSEIDTGTFSTWFQDNLKECCVSGGGGEGQI